MIETGKIINGDCIEVMKTLPEGSVDLICTSPPYGVGIAYDVNLPSSLKYNSGTLEFMLNYCFKIKIEKPRQIYRNVRYL